MNGTAASTAGNDMKNYEWKQKYRDRLIKYGGLTKKQAMENCRAIGEIDYTINPESAADDEISYMKGD